MPDFTGIIKNINAVLQLIFGKNIPTWVSPLLGWILLAVLFLCGIWGLLVIISKIKDLWIEKFHPLLYKPEQKRRLKRRQSFAKHIEYEILRIGLLEDWKDDRFTELEAEVEAEGRRKAWSFIPFVHRAKSGFRREKSLSKAIELSQERLILVEGEPGAGKSVALRHVAQNMAEKARKSRNIKSIIPLYINLKELERSQGTPIDRNLIESFILKALKRVNDRDVDRFLDDEFSAGIENGTWFFLFDSFDEIPEVLASTEADEAIRGYGDAIADFLGGMNQCRGVIASRHFRGPKQFGWPRFRVLALTEKRQVELIRKADLGVELENELTGNLFIANHEIYSMASNPLFLNLICEHIKHGHSFPENAHVVFETYITSRLTRDKERIQKRFGLDTAQVRTFAEHVAFCMAIESGLGLSPSRANLKEAIIHSGFEVSTDYSTLLDALEYIKLARSEGGSNQAQSQTFTFAHRRFQEYFATCVVLREPERINPHQLLTDARWRETAVVLCQTQPIEALTPVLAEIEHLLTQMFDAIPNQFKENLSHDILKPSTNMEESQVSKDEDLTSTNAGNIDIFPWPPGSLHLLGLLQEGFGSRLKDIPETIRLIATQLVFSATEKGLLPDRIWALEVSGTIFEDVQEHLLKKAFLSQSLRLREVAYRQAAHLKSISPDIAQGIRDALVRLASTRRLSKEKQATRAHLKRLHQSSDFLATMYLLLYFPFIDYILLFATFSISFSYHYLINYKITLKSPLLIIAFSIPLISYLTTHLIMRDLSDLLPFNLSVWKRFFQPRNILLASNLSIWKRFFQPRNDLLPSNLSIWKISSKNRGNLLLFMILTIALEFRFAIVYYLPSGLHDFMYVICLSIALYIFLFGISAFYAAKYGKFTKTYLWLLIPFGIVWYFFIKLVVSMIQYIPKLFKSPHLKRYIVRFIILASILFIYSYFSYIFFFPLLSFLNTIISSYIFSLIEMFFIFILIFPPIFNLVIYIYLSFKWISLYNTNIILSSDELCKIMNKYKFATFQKRILGKIKRKELIIDNKELEAFLVKVFRDIEVQDTKQTSKQKKDEYSLFISKIDKTILDDLSLILEDIRNNRL